MGALPIAVALTREAQKGHCIGEGRAFGSVWSVAVRGALGLSVPIGSE